MLFDPNWSKEPVVVPSIEPWREILFRAADLLEKHGHCKYTMEAKDGRMCAGGAIMKAGNCTNGLISTPLLTALNKIAAHVGDQGVVCWNDAKERTAQEVIATLRMIASSS